MIIIKKYIKHFIVILGGISGALYLLNPTAGMIEVLPDNLPYIGNLDEGAATILVLGCLRFYGLDLIDFFKKK